MSSSSTAAIAHSPAFPCADLNQDGTPYNQWFGLTKREHIATELFAAMITTSGAPALLGIGPGEDQFARAAVKLADVLIAELAKAQP